ncbi:FdtA/QdtA family cupin domain-containing protein [Algivirga pacifica]|uniref:FdtA/QdtA family cupin domain-containing protein n=1 Tax=Algivirga pacifica TaxID=1162670 RepID=A0ABP9DAB8_9BACT
MKYPAPYLIDFPCIGEASIGFISVAEYEQQIPFNIQRVFWTYGTPEHVVRGQHAHYETEEVVIAVAGTIEVRTESPEGVKEHFVLKTPGVGLYLPPHYWRSLHYHYGSVQVVLVSTLYKEEDYIRSYDNYEKVYRLKSQ